MSPAVRLTAVFIGLALLGACGSFGDHVVSKGETLYSISWRYGQDYRQLAAWNHIPPPYIIHQGQRLRLTPPGSMKSAQPPLQKKDGTPRQQQKRKKPAAQAAQRPAPAAPQQKRILSWSWPAEGSLISRFSAKKPGRKGIDIAGHAGAAVKAAAAGRVVYSGSGIQRYGNLLIIKHNDKYLSAYAHNRRLLVQEGTLVKQGQRIAEMGRSGTGVGRVMLHFEIRADGVPVDPLAYLPVKKVRGEE